MNIRANTQIFNKQGLPIFLTKEIGRGGEGSVYETKEISNLVAKVYHKPIDSNKADKLSLMVNLKTERLCKLSAWPVDILYEKPGGDIIGFLMEKVTGYKEIHNLYSPKSRLNLFPEAYWQFLLHAATNVARVFSVIHEHGHVIADVNHANILVSKDATIFLIDCDSFQIHTPQKTFLCEVGTSTHTPPELQDKSFREFIRNQNHDLFGLSVIIFQLLFMGRHPFSGKYLGVGDMTLERAIKEYRFAYSFNSSFTQMSQPPATLSLSHLSPYLTQLFEQSFSKSLTRPTAKDWIAALTEISTSLKKCENSNGHQFYKHLSSCPWCDIEVKSGILLFNIQISAIFQPFEPSSRITKLWLEFQAIQAPNPIPELPDKKFIKATSIPSATANSVKTVIVKQRNQYIIIFSGIFFVITLFTYMIQFNIFIFFIIIIGIAKTLDLIINKSPSHSEIINLQNVKKVKEAEIQSFSQLLKEDGNKKFSTKKQELEKKHEDYSNLVAQKRREYNSLPTLRKQKLDQLEMDNHKDQRKNQLISFLDKHRIIDAKIPGIGKSRTATLQSYGIETALDIYSYKIVSIPGFGTSYTSNLLSWRNSIEAKFVFDPTNMQSISQTQIANVDKELKEQQLQLQKELLKIETEYEKTLSEAVVILNNITAKNEEIYKKIYPSATETIESLVQIETDLNFIGIYDIPYQSLKAITRTPITVIFVSLLTFGFFADLSHKNYQNRIQENKRIQYLKELEIQREKEAAYKNKIKTQMLAFGDDSKIVKEMFGDPIKIIINTKIKEGNKEVIWQFFPYKKRYLLNIGFFNDKIIGWVDKRNAQEVYGISKEITNDIEQIVVEYNSLKNALIKYNELNQTSTFDQDLALNIAKMKDVDVGKLFLSYNQELLPTKLIQLQNCFFSTKKYLQKIASKIDERINISVPNSTSDVTLYDFEQVDYTQTLESEILLLVQSTINNISEGETLFNNFNNFNNSTNSTNSTNLKQPNLK